MRITQASTDDVPRLLPCAQEFTRQLPDCPLNDEHFIEVLTGFLETGNGVIFILEADDGSVAGAICGIKHPCLLTGRLMAAEIFWYVTPAHRGSTASLQLLKDYEEWAKASGCQHVNMAFMEASMPEKLKRFYHQHGYELLETVWRKRI